MDPKGDRVVGICLDETVPGRGEEVRRADREGVHVSVVALQRLLVLEVAEGRYLDRLKR